MATEKTLWICNAGAGVLGLPPAFVQDIPGYPDSELEKYCDFSFASAKELSDLL